MDSNAIQELQLIQKAINKFSSDVRKLKRILNKQKIKGGKKMNNKGQINVQTFINALIVGIIFIPFIIIMDVLTYNILTPNIGSTSYGTVILMLYGLIPLLMALFIIIGVIQYTQRPREQ